MSVHSHPDAQHVYGKPNLADVENAKQLTSRWTEHAPTKVKVDCNSVNFVSVNRQASKHPNVSAKAIDELAARIKARQASQPLKLSENEPRTASSKHTHANLIFGKASPQSIPFIDVIQNKYGNEGESNITQRYKQYYNNQLEASRTKTTVKPTKSSQGHSLKPNPIESTPKELFKLSKYKNVPSRLMT